jgi:DinB superfamily
VLEHIGEVRSGQRRVRLEVFGRAFQPSASVAGEGAMLPFRVRSRLERVLVSFMTIPARLERPDPSEHSEFHARYVNLTPEGDIVATLAAQLNPTLEFVRSLEIDPDVPTAPGKWSLKQILGHMIDTERVFSYRALSFARGDQNALPGMEQDDFQAHSGVGARSLEDLFMEFTFLRRANVLMFEGLPPEAWLRVGTASGARASVRALAHMLAGHELHHRHGLERQRKDQTNTREK